MTRTMMLAGLLMVAACAKQEAPATDSAAANALPPIDTVKLATDTLQTRDSLGALSRATKTASTATKTQTKGDSGRLRDVVTPLDTSKPMLPPAKKKPD